MQTVPELLRSAAARHPDALALVVDGGDSLTLGTWERRSNAAARGLVARGVRAGERVGLFFDNARWTELAVAYLAVHKAGAVAVPVSSRFAPTELAHVLAHCEAVGVVSPPDLAVPARAGWRASPRDLEEGHDETPYQEPLTGDDLADILYTSGTTGAPKGVECSHANLVFEVEVEARAGDGRGDPATVNVVHAFPPGTNAGQDALRLPLRKPGSVAMVLPVFDPERLCALVAERRLPSSSLFLVPAMARMLLDSGAWQRHDLSTVAQVVLTSAPTPPVLLPAVAAAFPGARICNVYALTEAGPARTMMVYDPSRPASVGRPGRQSEVRVVDEEGHDVAAGETGEIWIRRPGAPRRRYHREPEATAELFVGDWLRTGDLGRLDEEGYLYLVDRKKDIIISGGSNVSSLEVEAVLVEHPAVVEAAVFGVPHDVLGQDVAAAVVARTYVTARELQAFVRLHLAEHKTPHSVYVVDELPRNASGKVLKHELRARFGAQPARAGHAAPTSRVEAAIMDIWKQVLATDDIQMEQDFFAAGGHSLAAAQVVARMEDAFGVTIDVNAVFDAPTIAELAMLVESARRKDVSRPRTEV